MTNPADLLAVHAPDQVEPGSGPALLLHRSPSSPTGVALFLHGGAEHGLNPVDESSLSWRRTGWMMREITAEFDQANLAIALLRYRVKGWNAGPGAAPSPVPDARWALDAISQAIPDTPVILIGHSMGGRTACAVADHRSVHGVVALAPWLPAGDSVTPLAGKRLTAIHGLRDRITSARATRRFTERAASVSDHVEYVALARAGHYMISRRRSWNRLTAAHTLAMLG